MRNGLLALLLVFSSLGVYAQESAPSQDAEASRDWYYGKPIKDIQWEGLKNVKLSELEGISKDYIGRLFDDELYWELQGRLYGLELFDFISPSALPGDDSSQTVVINFSVTEKPVVSRIIFEGNVSLRRNALLDAVTIKVEEVVTPLKMSLDEQAVRDLYLSKGYTDVLVSSETRPAGDGRLLLVFKVSEGQKLAIEGFRFEGNTAFSERALRGLLTLKQKSLINDGAFQESSLVADISAIETYYRERGYVDAKVVDVVRESRADEDGANLLTLVFKIGEGKQFTYGGTTFVGNKIFSTEQLDKLLGLKVGQLLNYKRLEADFQAVADLYYENGYIFNTINRQETRDENALSIAYTISIVERPRAHIENIIIEGNVRTRDEVILREIPLQEGDIFSKTKVLQGLRNLYNLQFFSLVNPETPQGSEENLMDLVFVVEEQSTADIQFGVTFSGTTDVDKSPVSMMVKLSDKNFLGMGNTAGVEVSYSNDLQKLSLQYTERWLFGLPLSGAFDFTVSHGAVSTPQANRTVSFNGDEDYAYPFPYSSWDEYYDASKTVPEEYLMDYEKWSLSLGFSTGYRFLLDAGILSVGGGLRTALINNSYDTTLYRPFDPTVRDGANEWLLQNSVSAYTSLDSRDIYYDPSKGYYALQRFNYVGLLPEIERERYIRSETKAEFYWPLFDVPVTESWNFKMVFAAHSGLAFIFPQFDDEPIIKSASKFYIDGMFYARGWTNVDSILGLSLWENWAELRIPLVPGILAWDFFFDAAAVKETPSALFTQLAASDFFFSLGGGLRITIPQFPFRFSLAKRFKFNEDNGIDWQKGALFGESLGLDFVLSFALSSY